MKELKITAKIDVYNYEELNSDEKKIIEEAKCASQNAYAPYSGFKVGAAVLLDNGEIVTGNNQENVAYPSGLCAERVAMFHACSVFPQAKIKSIAIAAFFNGDFVEKISPCGACRQVLVEAEKRSENPIKILMFGKNEILSVESIKELMPLAFKF